MRRATPDFMFERLAGALAANTQQNELQARLLSTGDATYRSLLMRSSGVRPTSFDFAINRIIRVNQFVFVTWEATADSSGFGSGVYSIDLPFTPVEDTIGSWFAVASSTGNECSGQVRYQSVPSVAGVLSYHSANPGARIAVSPTAPWTWATGDFLSVTLAYATPVNG